MHKKIQFFFLALPTYLVQNFLLNLVVVAVWQRMSECGTFRPKREAYYRKKVISECGQTSCHRSAKFALENAL